ncbi:MAG: hypothetical protein V3S51_04110, partial [Dehalococcoidia bacterium]
PPPVNSEQYRMAQIQMSEDIDYLDMVAVESMVSSRGSPACQEARHGPLPKLNATQILTLSPLPRYI